MRPPSALAQFAFKTFMALFVLLYTLLLFIGFSFIWAYDKIKGSEL